MNAVLGGLLLGAPMLIAMFTLDGSAIAVILPAILVAFVGGFVFAAYSEYQVEKRPR